MEEVEGPTVPDETGQAKRDGQIAAAIDVIGVAELMAQLTAA